MDTVAVPAPEMLASTSPDGPTASGMIDPLPARTSRVDSAAASTAGIRGQVTASGTGGLVCTEAVPAGDEEATAEEAAEAVRDGLLAVGIRCECEPPHATHDSSTAATATAGKRVTHGSSPGLSVVAPPR
jgi:hypothetical protein